MRQIRVRLPELTHDRAVLHAGLAALAVTEWASLHGPELFARPVHASIAALVWAAVVSMLAETDDFQPHVVEALTVTVLALIGSAWGYTLAGVGAHYWAMAHPVGSLLTAVFTVTYLVGPLLGVSVATGWLGEWVLLRQTTPEERVLESKP